MDACWRDTEKDGFLGTEFERHGELRCTDVDLEFATVRGWVECVTMTHRVTDRFRQWVGEEDVVYALAMDAPIIRYLVSGDQGWVGNTESPVAMDVGQGEQRGEDIVVAGVTISTWLLGRTDETDRQTLAPQPEQLLEGIQ